VNCCVGCVGKVSCARFVNVIVPLYLGRTFKLPAGLGQPIYPQSESSTDNPSADVMTIRKAYVGAFADHLLPRALKRSVSDSGVTQGSSVQCKSQGYGCCTYIQWIQRIKGSPSPEPWFDDALTFRNICLPQRILLCEPLL